MTFGEDDCLIDVKSGTVVMSGKTRYGSFGEIRSDVLAGCWQRYTKYSGVVSSTTLCLGRLRILSGNKVGLKCPPVRPPVHSSTESSVDFNEIWRVGRGRWVMHDCLQYDPIKGQGHEPLKVANPSIFKSYRFRHLQWELATDHRFLN